MKKAVFFLFLLIAFIVGAMVFHQKNHIVLTSDLSRMEAGTIQYSENEPDYKLGGGAYAYWSVGGLEKMDETGYASNTLLVLHGADKEDIVVDVHLNARIGPLNKDILNL